MTKKKEEHIIDKPTKKEIKTLLKKADKVFKNPEKKKTPKQPDKLDLILSNLKNFENRLNTDHDRLDRIENLLSKRDTDEQKKQIKSTPELTPEEKLAQAQEAQKKVAGQEQPGQAQGQPTPEEAAQAALQLQRDIATAQGQQDQGKQPGQALTPQNAWLLERVADAAKVIVPAVLQSKNNTGNPLKGFFEQLKIYQSVENTVLSGFFNFMKMLPGNQREAAISGIMTSQKVPTMISLPHKSEIIE